ncbi:hypothetical protein H5410_030242 [Solanum commersonii]|uniref:Uncharacterized protein n=1 Tax=Solanum commersonii TaxID=4109 RepID=A0A9J5YGW0_SOLCO|nr:hypothetical protein H5410_030242 [Solanum commersonii]
MLYQKLHSKIKIQTTQLVGIADALGDTPFSLFHRLSAFAFSIFAFWIIGAQHTGTLDDVKAIRRLAECIRRSLGLLFFVFAAVLFLFVNRFIPFCQAVSILYLKLQIPETSGFASVIETKYAFEDTNSIKMKP